MNWLSRLLSAATIRWCSRVGLLLGCGVLLLAPTLSVRALMPPTWTYTAPTGWANRPTVVSVTATNDVGLQPLTALYRYSTDGGQSWSDWIADATLQRSSTVPTTVYLTATVASFVDSDTRNRIEFGIQDNELNINFSPSMVVHVDTTAPGAPLNLVAVPAGWTRTDDFALFWSNPFDLSGIARVYVKVGDTPPAYATDYTATAPGADITSLSGITLGVEGHKFAYVWLGDEAGNRDHTRYAQVELWLDATPPGAPQNASVAPAVWSATNAFTITWANPPQPLAPIAKAYFRFDAPPVAPADANGWEQGAGITQLAHLAAPREGLVPCYVWLEDAAGNAGYTSAISMALSFSGGFPPPKPFLMQIDPITWTKTCAWVVSWSNPTVPSGIAAAWYKWGTEPTHAEDGTRVAGAEIHQLIPPAPAGDGEKTIYVWLEDGAGMKDHQNNRSKTAYCDTTAPLTTLQYTPPRPEGPEDCQWFKTPVTICFTVTDTHAGVDESQYPRWWLQGGLEQTSACAVLNESTVLSYYAVDRAGNRETTKTITVAIDLQAPTTEIALSSALPAQNGWYRRPVTITLTAQDDRSGLGCNGGTFYQIDGGAEQRYVGPAVLVGNGPHTVSYYSRDAAGNVESTRSVQFYLDQELPTITHAVEVTTACAYLRPPVQIALRAADSVSGVDRVEYRPIRETTWAEGTEITLLCEDGDGTHVFEYRAWDWAGNVSAVGVVTVQTDCTAPRKPSALTPSQTSWTQQDGHFGLHWTNPPELSGVAAAYYRIDGGPRMGPVRGEDISALANITVTTEGLHSIYVWLEDCLGNSDEAQGEVLTHAFKLDLTPPYCDSAVVNGPSCGGQTPVYFTGPVTITITGHDALSGVGAFYYQVEDEAAVGPLPVVGGPSLAQHSFSVYREGMRKNVHYWATDAAGNAQGVSNTVTLYFDGLAPRTPISATVSPSGWISTNNFSLTWANPVDYSGVIAAYLKMGSVPLSNTDGFMYTPLSFPPRLSGLLAPQEGEIPLYLWLQDRACNVDYRSALSETLWLRYDRTSPATTSRVIAGALGNSGYYTSPVTLRFQCNDAASGCRETRVKINNGAWQILPPGQDLTLSQEGSYTVSYYSVDSTGNVESVQQVRPDPIRIDLFAPRSELRPLVNYVRANSLEVCWAGSDTANGSGIKSYTVQYRRNHDSEWSTWRPNTASTCDTFTDMQSNRFYYFRVRSEDNAGRLSEWTTPNPSSYVYREGLGNSSFDTCDWGAWVPCPDGKCPLTAQVVLTTTRSGGTSCMAQLSKRWPLNGVITDATGAIYQPIDLPELNGLNGLNQGLVLSFWYRILTYDVGWSAIFDAWIDTFEVHIRDINGRELALLLRDGRSGSVNPDDLVLYDLGWKQFSVDLSPWAGQRVQIAFEVWNRLDKWYPTWVYVDDISLQPGRRVFVYQPLILRNARGATGSASLPLSAMPVALPPTPEPGQPEQPPRR
jgi:hypothetical protein